MQLLKEEGYIKDFATRSGGKSDEKRDWDIYFRSCKNNANYLAQKKPDIVAEINEKIRVEKKKERKRRLCVEEDGGKWLYCGESGEYFWSGDGDPKVIHDEWEGQILTEED